MAILNNKKLRHSAAREKIFEYISSLKSHPSAEEIYDALKAENPNLSLGTVYRNLKQLEELGQIVKVASVNDKERYDAFCQSHVHFVCDDCGKICDAHDVDFDAVKSALSLGNGQTISRIKIVLNGICKDCGEKL